MTRDLFLLASLGALKFISAAGRNDRKHPMSRWFFFFSFFVSHRSRTRWREESDEFGDARGAHDAGFNELFCSPLVPPLKPPL